MGKHFSVDLLLENLPGVVYRCKPDVPWMVEYISNGILDLTGYTPEEFIDFSARFLSLIHPLDRERTIQAVSEATQAGRPFQLIYRLHDRNGNWKWVWEQGKAIHDGNNQVMALEGFIADITTLKETEQELAESKDRLELILESTSEGIYGVDQNYICTFINQSGAAILGYAPKELIGQNMHEMVHYLYPNGSPYPIDECPVVKAATEGRGIRVEDDVCWRKDGTSLSVTYSVSPQIADGKPCGAVIVFSDITDRKRAEEALQATELTYRLATEAGNVGTWEVDYATGITTISPITAKIVGLPPDRKTMAPEEWQAAIHKDDLPQLLQLNETAMRTGEPFSLEFRQYHHGDGRLLWLSMGGIVRKDPEGRSARGIGTLIDITEKKQAEHALQSEKERFQLLTEFSPDAILIDQDSVFVFANPAAAQLFGADAVQGIVGRPVSDFLPQESLDIVCGNRKQLMEDRKKPDVVELPMRRLDGALMDIQAVCGKTTWEGKPAVQVTLRDVTLLKKTQEKLRRTSERLQLAIEGTGEGIWDWDVPSNTFTFSGGLKHILGIAADEVAGTALEWRNAVHPEDIERVIERFRGTLAGKSPVYECEYRLRARDGTWKWVLARGLVVEYLEDGTPRTVTGTLTDITATKESATLAWRHANLDPLTSLPNRRLFIEFLQNELRRAERGDYRLALLFIDLDGFKQVNDLYGHEAGDLLLIETALRLNRCVRQTDIVSRLGGDEFTIILTQLEDLEHVQFVGQKILDALSKPFRIKTDIASVSASIGISLYPFDAKAPEEMLRKADQAMYAAKATGKNQFHYFTREMDDRAHFQLKVTNELRYALDRNQLSVHYQPVIDLQDGTIHKAEALLRWQHPRLGDVSPSEFIPLAEEAGLIKRIGNWVFKQAALCSKHCNEVTHAPFQISVNKSPVQFMAQDGDGDWTGFLSELGLAGSSITVEITEGVLLHMSAKVESRLLEFRDAGIQVALDDFGTGYSSMSYLKRFSIDYLKIDQSFVKDITTNPHSRTIAESIIVMAHKLGLKVIAEGIETQDQKDCLMKAGCDYGQGFLFSPPLPEPELIRLVERAAYPWSHTDSHPGSHPDSNLIH